MDADARFQVAPEVNWRDAPGELLLFDARADEYHVLNDAAAQVWRRLAAGAQLEAVADELSTLFDADRETILADAIKAAGDFLARGLLIELD